MIIVKRADALTLTSILVIANRLQEIAALEQFKETTELLMLGQQVIHGLACAQDLTIFQDIRLTITAFRLVVDKTDGKGS